MDRREVAHFYGPQCSMQYANNSTLNIQIKKHYKHVRKYQNTRSRICWICKDKNMQR